ncbi:MAG TPA: YhcH/YjgK/YiaL family protein [Lacunisphaera sp.]|nr:YhcH/YjgK/YiaL family protein [Lacunisphaera sp.]
MICGRIDEPADLVGLRRHPVWEEAFAWIQRHAATHPPGIVELRGKQMYVNVHGYETRPRAACRYESHRVYLDLQYCISGGELIEWHPLRQLAAKDEYDGAKDVIHHHSPAQPAATLRMATGNFAIFHATDGHMPKIGDGLNARVDKLVIKIDRDLLV